MSSKDDAPKIVDAMYHNDAFSQWLGIQRIKDGPGYSLIEMTVREEMTNGFKIAHGGISYSFADSAFAFASNARGRHAVSIETTISHLSKIQIGDVLQAEATEEHLSHKVAVYTVVVRNQHQEKVALFKGTVYRSSKEWDV